MLDGTPYKAKGASPDLRDVAYLWRVMTTELVTDLKFTADPFIGPGGEGRLRMSVSSMRYNDDHPEGYNYIWASKEYDTSGYLLSWGQLLDLLIVAHRAILAHFARYNLK